MTVCSTVSLVLAALLVASGVGRCQGVAPHAADGGARERLQSISIPAMAGAPFRATVVTEWTRLLADGTTTTIRNHRTVARDSTGRVFEERRFLSPAGDKEATALSALQYTDPERHAFYDCNPRTQRCMVYAYDAPADATAPVTPMAAAVTLPDGAGTVSRANLGEKRIENLETVGSREITTLSAGTNGYTRPEPTIKEFWFSSRLGVNVITQRFEPRGGAQNFTVRDIDLAEPDPRLFVPPDGFKMVRVDQP